MNWQELHRPLKCPHLQTDTDEFVEFCLNCAVVLAAIQKVKE